AHGAVAVEDPDVRFRPHELRPEREAGAHAQSSEDTGVEPGKGTARPQDVGRGGDEVPPVADHDAVASERAVDRLADREGIQGLARRSRRLDLDLSLSRLV